MVLGLVTAGAVSATLFLGTFTRRGCRRATCCPESETGMGELGWFSTDYASARSRFLGEAEAAGATLEHFQSPVAGPGGEPLFTDVATLGAPGAPAVLVVGSGTHGVEGFAGSAIQTGLLHEGLRERVPPTVRVVLIHAINPYGFAHGRRVNEDNVDPNRNFRDHTKEPPGNSGYEKLADAIAPRSLGFWSEARSWAGFFARYLLNRDEAQEAVSKGQYSHPDGLFYGGRKEIWSNRTIREITRRYLGDAARVVVVDIHTGLGEHAAAEIILNQPGDSAAFRAATRIWGADLVRTTVSGGSVSADLDASLKLAFAEMLGDRVTAVSLEFGTLPLLSVFRALRAENWLHHHGSPDHPGAPELKACLKRAFYPDSREWRDAVWSTGRDVVHQALRSLGSP